MRNRSKEEVDQQTTAEQALENERDFFAGRNLTALQLAVSKELRSLPDDRKGTVHLVRKLVQIQHSEIKKRMPGLRKQASAMYAALHCVMTSRIACWSTNVLSCDCTGCQSWSPVKRIRGQFDFAFGDSTSLSRLGGNSTTLD